MGGGLGVGGVVGVGRRDLHICHGNHNASSSYMGLPRFDMPMIDLKCVESPIANLGDLEEKGIRLVKLRKLKRKKTKDSCEANTDRSEPVCEGSSTPIHDTTTSPPQPPVTATVQPQPQQQQQQRRKPTAMDSSRSVPSVTFVDIETPVVTIESESSKPILPLVAPFDQKDEVGDKAKMVNPHEEEDLKLKLGLTLGDPEVETAEQEPVPEQEAHKRDSSITTPSNSSDVIKGKATKGVDHNPDPGVGSGMKNGELDFNLTNRDPYSTPLLPDIESSSRTDIHLPTETTRSRLANNEEACDDRSTSNADGNGELVKKVDGDRKDSIDKDSQNNTDNNGDTGVTGSRIDGMENPMAFPAHNILLKVERMDNTPTPLNEEKVVSSWINEKDDDDLEEEARKHNRFGKRSSSLLTVPDTVRSIISECRPPNATMGQENEINENEDDNINTSLEINLKSTHATIAEVPDVTEKTAGMADAGPSDTAQDGQLSWRRMSITVATQTSPHYEE